MVLKYSTVDILLSVEDLDVFQMDKHLGVAPTTLLSVTIDGTIRS